MILTLLEAPTELPIHIDEVKEFCRIEDGDNDGLVLSLMRSAVEIAESSTGRKFISQRWRLDLPLFSDKVRLPFPNIISVDSISYYDTSEVLQSLDSSYYNWISSGGVGIVSENFEYTYPQAYCRPDAVQISYTCGYAAPASVPDSLKNALFTIVWLMFDGRGKDLNTNLVNHLLAPFIMRGFL